jgi:hypothetical protein
MNKSDTIKILNDYNKWRRGGDDEALMPEPFDIGLALESAVKVLGEDDQQALLDEIKHKDAVIEVMRETLEEARCQLTDRADCRQEDSIFADRRNEGH